MATPSSTSERAARRLLATLAALLVLGAAGPSVAAEPAPQSAEQLARQAAKVAKGGDLKLAAEMFHAAFKLNGQAWAYLYSAARAEQLAGNIPHARRDYERFLEQAPAGHPLRPRAKKYAAEVERLHAEAMHKKRIQQREMQLAAKRKASAGKLERVKRIAGWVAVGLGLGTLGLGAWQYSAASGDRADLEGRTTVPDGELIRTISYAEAQNEAADIRSQLKRGATLASAGAALAAVGAVFVITSKPGGAAPSEVGLGLSGGPSLRVGWRF